jgi:hypothetical protein
MSAHLASADVRFSKQTKWEQPTRLSATLKSAHLFQKELRCRYHSFHTSVWYGAHSSRANPGRNCAMWHNKVGLRSPRTLDSVALVIPLDLPIPRVPMRQRRSVAMCIKSCELSLIVLFTSPLLWMSPALSRSSENTVFYRFAYRASRVPIDFEMGKSSWEDFR